MHFKLFMFAAMMCVLSATPSHAMTDAQFAVMQDWYKCASDYANVALVTSGDTVEDIVSDGFMKCTDKETAYAVILKTTNPDWTAEQQKLAVSQTRAELTKKLVDAYNQ